MRQLFLKSIKYILLIGFLNTSLAQPAENTSTISIQPRYAHGVVSIINDHSYIRHHEAPIYWKLSPYYLPQLTDASCSLASAIMVINALRIPQMQYTNQKLVTISNVMQHLNPLWAKDVKQGGCGVTLDQMGSYLEQILDTYNIKSVKVRVIHATKDKEIANLFHQALVDSEKNGRSFIIVNFNQKFINDYEVVGHFSPVGAYDASTKRVLIMDVDRELFEPYWIPESLLFQSMNTKDADSNKNRGFIILKSVTPNLRLIPNQSTLK